MQVWSQVKVKSGEHEGKAGVVQAVDGNDVTVKLDLLADTPLVFQADNLEVLGS